MKTIFIQALIKKQQHFYHIQTPHTHTYSTNNLNKKKKEIDELNKTTVKKKLKI